MTSTKQDGRVVVAIFWMGLMMSWTVLGTIWYGSTPDVQSQEALDSPGDYMPFCPDYLKKFGSVLEAIFKVVDPKDDLVKFDWYRTEDESKTPKHDICLQTPVVEFVSNLRVTDESVAVVNNVWKRIAVIFGEKIIIRNFSVDMSSIHFAWLFQFLRVIQAKEIHLFEQIPSSFTNLDKQHSQFETSLGLLAPKGIWLPIDQLVLDSKTECSLRLLKVLCACRSIDMVTICLQYSNTHRDLQLKQRLISVDHEQAEYSFTIDSSFSILADRQRKWRENCLGKTKSEVKLEIDLGLFRPYIGPGCDERMMARQDEVIKCIGDLRSRSVFIKCSCNTEDVFTVMDTRILLELVRAIALKCPNVRITLTGCNHTKSSGNWHYLPASMSACPSLYLENPSEDFLEFLTGMSSLGGTSQSSIVLGPEHRPTNFVRLLNLRKALKRNKQICFRADWHWLLSYSACESVDRRQRTLIAKIFNQNPIGIMPIRAHWYEIPMNPTDFINIFDWLDTNKCRNTPRFTPAPDYWKFASHAHRDYRLIIVWPSSSELVTTSEYVTIRIVQLRMLNVLKCHAEYPPKLAIYMNYRYSQDSYQLLINLLAHICQSFLKLTRIDIYQVRAEYCNLALLCKNINFIYPYQIGVKTGLQIVLHYFLIDSQVEGDCSLSATKRFVLPSRSLYPNADRIEFNLTTYNMLEHP
ncbi:hypothetical protein NEHOM01_0793 [Nematocida homosporus]|uniref:uncharacterized protein n=1 Tax=Nematocida homosporus TaxID=1912981 RepID=UPI0022209ED8|nr:uncharacterized protein NEHOM01_0793 [Nematocida homosporus]KAI5185378.1 hypothetical protein NEHOM01_0793 [Nematocida homosporus]